MSTSTRTPRRLAALAVGLTAVLAASVGPSVAAPHSSAGPAVTRTAAAAPSVVNPGNQVSLQYDSAYLPMAATGGAAPYT
ncbi:hypothetical protein ACFCXH_39330, partial [Streptomyces nojiriensis]